MSMKIDKVIKTKTGFLLTNYWVLISSHINKLLLRTGHRRQWLLRRKTSNPSKRSSKKTTSPIQTLAWTALFSFPKTSKKATLRSKLQSCLDSSRDCSTGRRKRVAVWTSTKMMRPGNTQTCADSLISIRILAWKPILVSATRNSIQDWPREVLFCKTTSPLLTRMLFIRGPTYLSP